MYISFQLNIVDFDNHVWIISTSETLFYLLFSSETSFVTWHTHTQNITMKKKHITISVTVWKLTTPIYQSQNKYVIQPQSQTST